MAISLVAVGAKITAAITNTIIGQVNAQGMTSVIPTSVAGSGVSVGVAGKVTFTAATAVSVNGCFTATYDNYLIILNMTTKPAADITARLRLAGTDVSTSTYTTQRIYATGSTVTGASTVGTSWTIDATTATNSDSIVTVMAPALAQATRASIATSSTSAFAGTGSMSNSNATSYDGITIIPPSATITGTMRVYGYNNN